MVETKPKTKGEECEELQHSVKTKNRLLKALCDANEVFLNGERFNHEGSFRPSSLTRLLDAHLTPTSLGNTVRFEFADLSFFEMTVICMGGERAVWGECGQWKFDERFTSEQKKERRDNV